MWQWYGLATKTAHTFRAWLTHRKHRRIDREWEAIGFFAVRPGHYMHRSHLTVRQLRAKKIRRDVVWPNFGW